MSHPLSLLIFTVVAGGGIIPLPTVSHSLSFAALAVKGKPANAPHFLLAQSHPENACAEGLALAQTAVKEGEQATTAQQWTQIAQKWQQASDLMAKVPPENSCYAQAQERIEFYRRNSEIALEEAQKQASIPLPNLAMGAEGERVQQLQQRLKELGYFSEAVNGIYGETTATAVTNFQRATGLAADGQVGQNTWDKLQSASPIISSPSPTPQESSAPKPRQRRNQKKRSFTQGLVGWVMMGLGGLTVLGGTVFILLKLLNRTEDEEDLEEEEPEELVTSEPPENAAAQTLVASENGESVESSTNDRPEVVLGGANSESAIEPSSGTVELPKEMPSPENSASSGELVPVNETTRLPKMGIIDDLIKDLQSADHQKRRQAIWELGQRGNSLAVQPLLNLLLDSDSGQRTLILSALSEIGVKTIKPMNRALSLSLQDDNPEVRKNAIRDFTRMYELIATVSHMMCHAVDDPDREVQEVAEWAVRQLRRISAASNLVKLKEDRSSRSRSDSAGGASDEFLEDEES